MIREAMRLGSRLRRALQRRAVLRRPLGVAGMVICSIWVIVAVFPGVIAPFDPIAQSPALYLPPGPGHWMGTDQLGRDVLSRIVWGSRTSILPAFALMASMMVAGTVLGGLAAYLGGKIDGLIMRLCDLLFSFPHIILAMSIVAVVGPSIQTAVVALALIRWPVVARVVRGLILSIRGLEYVQVSRMLGASTPQILAVDILPNVAGPLAVLAALEIGSAILLLSGLSFLGLGTRPPTPDWGTMVSEGARASTYWWIGAFPGLSILTVVVSFNLLGDTIRDALDPRLSRVMEAQAA